jgi:PAS domain S-box-containing protein
VLVANDAVARILGVGAREATSLAAADVYVDAADRDALLARCDASNEPQTAQVRWKRRDGTQIWVELTSRATRAADGTVVCYESFVQDITERRQAEQELRRSQEDLRDLATQLQNVREAERKYLSRELHDSLGQVLTALKIDLSVLAQRMPPSSRSLRAKLRAAQALVDTAMEVTHRVATELRPGILDDLGLVPAVRWAALEFERRTGLGCATEIRGLEAGVDDALATTIFRILQEALTNVARHADASSVQVTLAEDGRELTLVVQDDGKGIAATDAGRARNLGLLGMRERVSAWGGSVEVRGQPERGTTVHVRIPLAQAEAVKAS